VTMAAGAYMEAESPNHCRSEGSMTASSMAMVPLAIFAMGSLRLEMVRLRSLKIEGVAASLQLDDTKDFLLHGIFTYQKLLLARFTTLVSMHAIGD